MKRTRIMRLIIAFGLLISLAMGTASIAYASNTGWTSIDGEWRYMVSDDTAVTGWKKIGSSYYYFDETGILGLMDDISTNGKNTMPAQSSPVL